MARANKVYVAVQAEFDDQGNVWPLSIQWADGRLYEVDKVLDVRRAAAMKVGGTGIRYQIQIGQRRSYIWREEDDRWFVEAKESVQ